MKKGTYSLCVAYVVTAQDAATAKRKACGLAQLYYPEYEEFNVYHVEEVRQ